jgi:hypothetical protein
MPPRDKLPNHNLPKAWTPPPWKKKQQHQLGQDLQYVQFCINIGEEMWMSKPTHKAQCEHHPQWSSWPAVVYNPFLTRCLSHLWTPPLTLKSTLVVSSNRCANLSMHSQNEGFNPMTYIFVFVITRKIRGWGLKIELVLVDLGEHTNLSRPNQKV